MNGLKEIEGFEGYYAHPDGSVYTDKVSNRWHNKGELRLLKPKKNKSGYLYYGLFNGYGKQRKRYWFRGHRLIYQTFAGEIPNGLEIDHINGDRHNNSIDNLRLVTHSQNIKLGHQRRNALKLQAV
jgi:hypothetical protein